MPEVHYDIAKLFEYKETNPAMLTSVNSILCVLIDGVYCGHSSLSLLRSVPHVLQIIWTMVASPWKQIKEGVPTFSLTESVENVAFATLNTQFNEPLVFPKPKKVFITMMPFIMAESFEESKLPKYLKQYWENIIDKLYYVGFHYRKLIPESELGKVGYLTIHETYVKESKTEPKGRIRTHCPGDLILDKSDESSKIIPNCKCGNGLCQDYKQWIMPEYGGPSGITKYGMVLNGGIYMASNSRDSFKVYDYRILRHRNGEEIIREFGDVEHLREFLTKHATMSLNKMYWITDRTPYEQLQLKTGTYMQYFRMVTSDVSVWFEEHSTKNPNGVEPDPAITKVVEVSRHENKCTLF